MSDIFISYKKEDAGRVVRIVEALRAEGFSVWWDHGIAPGAQWDQTIQHQLDAAKAVVAVWSVESRNAPWVKEESAVGKNRGILVPVRIDDVDPPLGFTLIQASDLVGWSGDVKDPRWRHFTEALQAVLSGQKPVGIEAPLRRAKGPPAWAWAAGALALIAAGFAAYAALAPRPAPLVADAPVGAPAPPTGATPDAAAPPSAAAPGPTTTGLATQGPAASVAPPTAPIPSGPATAQERALFDQALTQKTRAAWQSFLAAYPTSPLAQRARDALLMCRTEQRPIVKAGVQISNQSVRGVGDTANNGPTEARACAAAKAMARAQAETNCRGFTTTGDYSNPRWTTIDRECVCTSSSGDLTICIVDMAATCQADHKTTEQGEVCG